jgi:hypothetical protein
LVNAEAIPSPVRKSSVPAYGGAHWVAPRHEATLFYEGYWDDDRGRLAHDHRSDRDRDRDFNRDSDRK